MNPGYAAALALTAVLAAALAWVSFRRRASPGASCLALFMAGAAAWAGTYALRWLSPSPALQRFWLEATYLGVATAPSAALAFSLRYTGRLPSLGRRLVLLLSLEPLLILLSLWTDSLHGLFLGGNRDQGAILEGGPLFWLHVVYSYGLLLLAALYLFRHFLRVSPLHRGQVGIMIGGLLLPWLANALNLAGLRPFPGLDTTPIAFALSGLLIGFGLFRLRLLDLAPLARDRLMELMRDGMLALDGRGRIVDYNAAALRVFGADAGLLGARAEESLSRWPALLEALRASGELQLELAIELGERRHYEAVVSPLRDLPLLPAGRLLLLHDVTRRRRAEEALKATTEELENFFTLTPDLFTIASLDGFFLRTSPSWEETLGYRPEELSSSPFFSFVHPEDLEATKEAMGALAEGRRIENFVNRYRCKDGSYRWIEWHSQPAGGLVYAAARDITERKRMEDELRYRGSHDALTGLYNRQYYEAELERLESSRAYPVSILVMDLNGFKEVNDRLGHAAGDELLRATARALRSSFRPEDMVARIGGDEFVVILPQTGQEAARKAEERVKETVEAQNRGAPPEGRIELAIGVSSAERRPLIDIFKDADAAMYKEKARMKGGSA